MTPEACLPPPLADWSSSGRCYTWPWNKDCITDTVPEHLLSCTIQSHLCVCPRILSSKYYAFNGKDKVSFLGLHDNRKKRGAPSVFMVGEATEGRNTNIQLINKLNNLKVQHANL